LKAAVAMSERINKTVNADGSVCFGAIPCDLHRGGLKKPLEALPGIRITGIIGDVTECWMDFTYRGYELSAHETMGLDILHGPADCPDEVLSQILIHCQTPKNDPPRRSLWRRFSGT
jgi:hypothetical protein